MRDPRRSRVLPESKGTAPNHPALASRTICGLYIVAIEPVFFTPSCQHAARRRLAHLAKHRVALGVRSERGREERLPVSARRVHDAARDRRIPWSVTRTWSSGCPKPRRSTGHNLSCCTLGALSLLDGPNLRPRGRSTSTPYRTWCCRRVALGRVRQAAS